VTGQRRLFPEPKLAAYARKDQVCAGGTYAGLPLAVLRRRDISPAAKLVYAALLDHLRGASTWVYPGADRLAAMTALSERGVRKAIGGLEAAGLIECRPRPGRSSAYAFAPPEDDGATGQEAPQAAQRPPCRPIDGSGDPTDAPSVQEAAQTPAAGPPAPAGPAPRPVEKRVDNSPAGGATPELCSGAPRNSVPPTPELRSAHPGTEFRGSTVLKHCAETPAQRGPPGKPPAPMDVASAWEDLLALDRRWRSERREFEDFEQLLAAATDLAEGRLGEPTAGWRTLSTVAHQVGRRDPPADSPVGMFLAEVRTLRLRQMRRRQQEGSKR